MDNEYCRCKSCEYCKIIQNEEEMCTYMKCTKTSKRGRTLDWHMTYCIDMDTRERVDIGTYFRERLSNKKKTPKWCPLLKLNK